MSDIAKFTPGPHFAERVSGDQFVIVTEKGAGQTLAHLFDKRGSFPHAEIDGNQYLYEGQAEANAYLFAAASDLYEALHDASLAIEALLAKPDDISRRPHAKHYADCARAALAKARGEA